MKPSTSLYIAGWLMVVSGLSHTLIGTLTNETWAGPLSIRKPILFGISTGITLVSLGWILPKLKPTTYDKWAGPLLAVSLLVEVGLITMQYWRGQASHFNHDTPANLWVDRSITVLIVIASLLIFDIARRSFLSIDDNNSMKLAIRGGMMFLLTSCGLGFFILFYGEHLASRGQSPTTFGAAGVMKFPHGITIHAVQYLPLLVWTMVRLRLPQRRQIRVVQYSIASLATLLLFSLWQTFNGLDRYDVGWIGMVILVFAASFAAAILGELAMGLQNRQAAR